MGRPPSEAAHEFDRAVHTVERGGEVVGAVAEGWDMGGYPNGGYLAAIALDALQPLAGDRAPVLAHATYVAPATVGPVVVRTEVQHAGGTHVICEGVLTQDGRDVARVRTVFTARRDTSTAYLRLAPPELPEPDVCIHPHPDLDTPFRPPSITGRVELRIRPEHVGFALGAPHGVAEIEGWARFADGREPDRAALPLFADSFPPAVFNSGSAPAWVPTLDLGVHLLGDPAPGWLRARFVTRSIVGGYLEEDGELWDTDGRLVAMSRQLALTPRGSA